MGCAFQTEGLYKQRLSGTPSWAAFQNSPLLSCGHSCSEVTLSKQIKAASIAGFIFDFCPETSNMLEHCKLQTTV